MESGQAVTSTNQRKSLEELGLVVPLAIWLTLLLIYLGACAVQLFVPDTDALVLRPVAFGTMMFIMGIFFSFKLPLWVPRNA